MPAQANANVVALQLEKVRDKVPLLYERDDILLKQGLAVGCKLLRRKLDSMDGDTTPGLLAWNGGGNPAYPTQVLARRAHYL